jgi:serine/threonine-protein kinase
MPSEPLPSNAALPPDAPECLAAICRRFEQAWQAGQRPRVEDHLHLIAAELRPALLGELLTIEVRHRRRLGEPPMAADASHRSPEHDLASADLSTVPPAPAARSGVLTTPEVRPAAPADSPPRPPVPRRYDLKRLLGQGGMGDVWLGRDRRLRRLVAVKVMQPRWAGNENVVRRFTEEAQLTSQLQHPGIPPV